jgi:hypothetical protein
VMRVDVWSVSRLRGTLHACASGVMPPMSILTVCEGGLCGRREESEERGRREERRRREKEQRESSENYSAKAAGLIRPGAVGVCRAVRAEFEILS